MIIQNISFNTGLSVQVDAGDSVYYATSTNGVLSNQQFAGLVTSVSSNSINVNIDETVVTLSLNDFIFIAKPIAVNESSIKGYYADLTIENASNKKAELFAISSDVTSSSK